MTDAGEFNTGLGDRLRTARLHHGLTQTELGKRLGLTRSTIANRESGRQACSAYDVVATAKNLGGGVTAGWLLLGDQSGEPSPQPVVEQADLVGVAHDLAVVSQRLLALCTGTP